MQPESFSLKGGFFKATGVAMVALLLSGLWGSFGPQLLMNAERMVRHLQSGGHLEKEPGEGPAAPIIPGLGTIEVSTDGAANTKKERDKAPPSAPPNKETLTARHMTMPAAPAAAGSVVETSTSKLSDASSAASSKDDSINAGKFSDSSLAQKEGSAYKTSTESMTHVAESLQHKFLDWAKKFDGNQVQEKKLAATEQDGQEKEVAVLKHKSGDSEEEKQTFAEVELLKNKLEMKKFNSESSVNQIKQLNVSYPMFSLIESRQMQAGLRTKCARDRDLYDTCGGSEPGWASKTCCAEDGLTCDLSVTPHICVKKFGEMCPILKDAERPVCETGSACIYSILDPSSGSVSEGKCQKKSIQDGRCTLEGNECADQYTCIATPDGSQEGVCKLKIGQSCVKPVGAMELAGPAMDAWCASGHCSQDFKICVPCASPKFSPESKCTTCIDPVRTEASGCVECKAGENFDPDGDCKTSCRDGFNLKSGCTDCEDPLFSVESKCQDCVDTKFLPYGPGYTREGRCSTRCRLPGFSVGSGCTECEDPLFNKTSDCKLCRADVAFNKTSRTVGSSHNRQQYSHPQCITACSNTSPCCALLKRLKWCCSDWTREQMQCNKITDECWFKRNGYSFSQLKTKRLREACENDPCMGHCEML